MNPAALRLEALHFPIQEVRANPLFNPQEKANGGNSNLEILQHKIEGREDAIGVEVTISSVEDASANNPYSFRLQGFCIITTGEQINDDESHSIVGIAVQIVIGAIREHLAAMTSRGPWGTHLINPIPLIAGGKKVGSQEIP